LKEFVTITCKRNRNIFTKKIVNEKISFGGMTWKEFALTKHIHQTLFSFCWK